MSETKKDKLIALATEALEAIAASGEPVAKGSQILQWIREKKGDEVADELRGSWGSYLTQAAQDDTNRIARNKGGQGYLLAPEGSRAPSLPAEPAAPGEVEEGEEEGETQKPRVDREQRLYGLVADWLEAEEGYDGARVVGGKRASWAWQNPDVVGLKVLGDVLGNTSIEICSIEVKTSYADWKHWIFEAVAHKRFAHRVYFAFAIREREYLDTYRDDFREMRRYGEKFGIGVLAVFLSAADYERFWAEEPLDEDLSLADVEVFTVWPALREDVAPEILETFLRETLEIQDKRDLYGFGRVEEE